MRNSSAWEMGRRNLQLEAKLHRFYIMLSNGGGDGMEEHSWKRGTGSMLWAEMGAGQGAHPSAGQSQDHRLLLSRQAMSLGCAAGHHFL